MLTYFIALLQGKRGLAAILHVLEQTRDRLDTFVEEQELREDAISRRVLILQDEKTDVRQERHRAQLVYNNLTNVLGLGESEK